MLTVSCPSCGAPVNFRSHAAVMAVCEFCRANVVKDLGEVHDLGKMSSVLEDYSRIQIGTAGKLAGRSFTVVGRIQLRYAAGMWNEWFLMFDDDASGWLGDSSGQYVITTERALGTGWPAFDQIDIGAAYRIDQASYTASERRLAECVGGQGELPFRVGQGWQARVADFRKGSAFATLDYSDSDTPTLYAGKAVTLEQLDCQLLRDDEAIKAGAGKYRGRVESLECPACGTAIAYLPGLTSNLVCQSCRTQLDAANPQVQVLAKGEQAGKWNPTIPLGATGRINGKDYRVIGAMVRVDDEGEEWTEYLLFSTEATFFWLVESNAGWSSAHVMNSWPEPGGPKAQEVLVERDTYRRQYAYPATVQTAMGAFNWRVAVGDRVEVIEYAKGQSRLAAEMTADELTWSRSSTVAFDQVRTWFGAHMKNLPPTRDQLMARNKHNALVGKCFMWLFGLNAIPLMANFGGSALWLFFGSLALLAPYLFMGKAK
jgi:uncharacterized protein (DUF983 family)